MNTMELRAERLRREPALKAARLMLDCFTEGDDAVIEAFIERGGMLFGEAATRDQLARFAAGHWQCTSIDELPPVVTVVVDLESLTGVEPDLVVLAQVSNGAEERTLGLAIVDDAPVSIFDPRPIASIAYKQAVELSQVLSKVES